MENSGFLPKRSYFFVNIMGKTCYKDSLQISRYGRKSDHGKLEILAKAHFFCKYNGKYILLKSNDLGPLPNNLFYLQIVANEHKLNHNTGSTRAFVYQPSMLYRSGTVNSKSFVGKVFLRIKWKFEFTMHFKYEMIAK